MSDARRNLEQKHLPLNLNENSLKMCKNVHNCVCACECLPRMNSRLWAACKAGAKRVTFGSHIW